MTSQIRRPSSFEYQRQCFWRLGEFLIGKASFRQVGIVSLMRKVRLIDAITSHLSDSSLIDMFLSAAPTLKKLQTESRLHRAKQYKAFEPKLLTVTELFNIGMIDVDELSIKQDHAFH